MDGHGWGEAANDDGSGTALVMELARIFSSPDVQTERSIRFILWNNEETGLNGARAYVEQRQALQGKEDPAGLGQVSRAEVARHDPARHDDVRPRHAARRRHGEHGAAARGRREHRVPVELEDGAQARRSWRGCFTAANEKYATDYPAAVGPHMTNTDSAPFQDLVAGDQPARERARHADRRRLGSALAPADRRLHDVQRQGLPARPERGADDARRRRAADRRDGQVSEPGRACGVSKGRLEAFSDGVIAIIITIMVLELKVPQGHGLAGAAAAAAGVPGLRPQLRVHRHLLEQPPPPAARHGARSTAACCGPTCTCSSGCRSCPFVTGMGGREPRGGRCPAAVYGVVLLMCGVAYTILLRRILRVPGANSRLAAARRQRPSRASCRCCSTRGHPPGVRQPVAVGCDLRRRGADVAGAGPPDRERAA